MTKILLPSLELTILIINFASTNLKIVLETLQIENFKRCLILLSTWQWKKFRNILGQVKLENKTIPKPSKLKEWSLCNNCVCHLVGYIMPCLSLSFKLANEKNFLMDL